MNTGAAIVKRVGINLGKILLGGIMFYGGILFGSILASAAGLSSPYLPPGVDEATLATYVLVGSVLVAAVLVTLTSRLATGFLQSWFIVSVFAWITVGVNTALEATVFVPSQASFGFITITYGIASLVCGGVVAWMYSSNEKHYALQSHFRAFWVSRPRMHWLWRLITAVAAFPVIYVVFGVIVEPIVVDHYVEQVAGLQLPTWEELLPVLFARSALFLIACLPILITWRGSTRNLFLALGFGIFVLVGGVYMMQSYWLPLPLRVAHGLEMLGSSFAYTGALILLIRPRNVDTQKGLERK